MVCYGNVSIMRHIYGKSFDNTRQHIFLKTDARKKVTVVAQLYMNRLRDLKMCSQTKFGIPRIYACDTVCLELMAVVKVRDAPWP